MIQCCVVYFLVRDRCVKHYQCFLVFLILVWRFLNVIEEGEGLMLLQDVFFIVW